MNVLHLPIISIIHACRICDIYSYIFRLYNVYHVHNIWHRILFAHQTRFYLNGFSSSFKVDVLLSFECKHILSYMFVYILAVFNVCTGYYTIHVCLCCRDFAMKTIYKWHAHNSTQCIQILFVCVLVQKEMLLANAIPSSV